jgi:hypothetical protein
MNRVVNELVDVNSGATTNLEPGGSQEPNISESLMLGSSNITEPITEVVDLIATSSSGFSETDDEWEVDYVVSDRVNKVVYLNKLRWKN